MKQTMPVPIAMWDFQSSCQWQRFWRHKFGKPENEQHSFSDDADSDPNWIGAENVPDHTNISQCCSDEVWNHSGISSDSTETFTDCTNSHCAQTCKPFTTP